MKQLSLDQRLGSLNGRLFIGCLLAFAILINPIVAIAGRARQKPEVKNPKPEVKAASENIFVHPTFPAPVAVPLVPTITATMTDAIINDDGDTKADPTNGNPGTTEKIEYTVTISNTGPHPATNVLFTNTIDAHSTLVAGSVSTQPIAFPDSYNATGNVRITVPNGPGDLLSNDIDPDTGNDTGLSITSLTGTASDSTLPFSITTTNGATVTASLADGSFQYNPGPGFTGSDSFTYTVTDPQGKTDTQTVTLNVTGMIWFVQAGAPAGGNGRLTNPFNCLVGAGCFDPVAADDPGDNIFLYSGAYTGGLTLLANQRLIGQGAGASLSTITGLTPPTFSDPLPATGGARPTITTVAVATSAITVGSGNTLRGLDIGNTTAVDITGTAFGTLTILEMTLNGTGRSLNLANGTLAATFDNLTATNAPGGAGVSLTTVSGTLTVSGTTSITTAGGAGITISGSSVAANFGTSTTITDPVTQGILVGTSTGNLSFGNTTVSDATDAISLTNNSAGTRSFGTITTTNGTGVGFLHTTGGGLVTVSGATSITNPGGRGIDIQNSTTAISFGAANVTQSGGTGVNLQSNSAGITFADLDISPDAAQRGFHATSNTGTLTTTSGVIASSTTGVPIEIVGVSAANRTPLAMALESVNGNGAANGIVLSSTSGTFTVNGTGTNLGSGGTIQNITNRGASFINTNGITLKNMNFTNVGTVNGADPTDTNSTCGGLPTGGNLGCNAGIHLVNVVGATFDRVIMNGGVQQGINGNNVTTFSLTNSSVLNFGNETREDGLRIKNLLGTNTMTNTTVTGNEEHQMAVMNTSGTLTAFNVSGSTFSNSTCCNGGDGIQFEGRETANMSINVSSSTMSNNAADGFFATVTDTADMIVTVSNSTLNGNVNAAVNLGAVDGITQFASTLKYTVTANTISGGSTQMGNFININLGAPSTGTLEGTVSGNNITGSTAVGAGGAGIRVVSNGSGFLNTVVSNNTVTNPNGDGITFLARDGSSDINATVTGNNVSLQAANLNNAIYVQSGAVGTDTTSICADIGGAGALANTASVINALSNAIRIRNRFAGTLFRLPGYGGGGTDTAAAEMFLEGRNNETGPVTATLNGNTFGGGAACTQPVAMINPELNKKREFFADNRTDMPAQNFGTMISTNLGVAQPVTLAAQHVIHSKNSEGLKTAKSETPNLTDARAKARAHHASSSHKNPRSEARKTNISDQKSEVRSHHRKTERAVIGSRESGVGAHHAKRSRAVTTMSGETVNVAIGTLAAGDSVTITYQVTVNNPPNLTGVPPAAAQVSNQGTVTFTETGSPVQTDEVAGGAVTPTLTPVDLFDTSTTLVSSLNPSNFGDLVTFTANVAETPVQASANPSGTVDFIDTSNGNAVICNDVALTSGSAQCQTSTLTAGTHNIRADYSGDGNFDPSQSNIVAQVVNACTPNPIVTSTGDNGGNTLRQALSDVCSGTSITFNIAGSGPHTITLTTGELVVAKNVTIKNNSGESTTVSGGGASRVFNINAGKTASIVGLTITNGSANNGGGISNSGTLTVVNSTISGNTATAGSDAGGIANSGTMTLVNSTVSGNSSASSGGGIKTDGVALTIINSTITKNLADSPHDGTGAGGGIFRLSGTLTLHNTIVAGNLNKEPVMDAPDDVDGVIQGVSSNNLIGIDTNMTGIINGDANNNQVGTGGSPIDAMLGALANNGGLTFTHALLAGSPAIEKGNNVNLPADSFDLDGDANVAEILPVDQRGVGYARTADSEDPNATQTVDIGAYEKHPTIENIGIQTTPEDTQLNVTFNLGDATGVGSPLIQSVVGTSSNQTLVPDANITVDGTGTTRTIHILPAANQNGGPVTITVTVTGTNLQTAVDTFNLTITEVNDAPDAVNDNLVAVDEDSGQFAVPLATLLGNDTKGPNEIGQQITVTGVSNFLGGSASLDTLNSQVLFTPNANFNGSASFDYTITDNGTTGAPPVADPKSDTATASFTVNSINDAPSFVKGADQTVNKNAGAQTVANWATAISGGPPDEVTAGQTVSFNVSVTGTTGGLTFAVAPAVTSSGTLTYTATNGTSGSANVSVTAVDTGLSAPLPNSNTSGSQTFTITVTGVNVAPVNTVPASVSLPQNTVYTFTGTAISVADADAADTDNVISVALTATNGTMNLSGTAGLNFTGGSNGTAAMTFEGTIPNLNAALNNMTFTPTPGYTGAASIQMVSNDLGKTGTGGPQSDTDTINIAVTPGAGIFINEILFNPPGADAPNEYIELRGSANTVVPAGTYLVAVEGDAADNPGDVQTIIHLSGLSFGSNGFLVLLQNGHTYTTQAGATVVTSTTTGFGGLPGGIFQADGGVTDIEDASATFMLVQTGVAPTLSDDVDVDNDGTPDGAVYSGWNVRDSIGVLDGSAIGDRAYGAFNFSNNTGTNGTATGTTVLTAFTAGYVGRIGDSTGSTAADWVASGVLGGAAPNWTLGVAAETAPSSFAGKALNHIGAPNFVNFPPVNSVPGAQNVNEDLTLTFNAGNANLISISDADAGGADVKVTLTALNGTMSLSGTAGLTFTPPGTVNDGTNDTQMIFTGTIANINTALNNLTFTPTGDFFSPPVAGLTILTEDQGNTGVGGNKTDNDTINITVNAVNDPPSFTLAGNPPTVNEDAGAQTVNGFATSISQGPGETGQTLTFNVSPTGTTGNIAFSIGPVINATTGALTYTTSANTNGTATFSVTLSDNGNNVAPNSNASGAQVFTITVNTVNDAPTFQIPSNPPTVNEDEGAQAVNSFATIFQPGPVTATDEIGQTLVGYTVTPTGTTGNLAFTSGPSINNAGQLTYTPTTNTSGTATFNAVAIDSGSGTAPNVNQSAPVAFTITVTGQNDAPTLDNTGNMSLSALNEDVPNANNPSTLVSDITASAGGDRITDVDPGALEGLAVIAVDNTSGTWQFSIDGGTNWTPLGTPDPLNARLLAANATTRVRFIPNLNFNGTVDPGITFRAWDQTSGMNGNTADVSTNGGTTAFSTAIETGSITVNAVNDIPTANAQSTSTNEDTPKAITLTGSDIETASANLTFTVTAQPTNGVLSGTGSNRTYTPNANYNGADSFKFTVTDTGDGASPPLTSAEATISLNVIAVNDPPTADSQSVSTNEDTAKPITLIGNDIDTAVGSLSFIIVSGPGNGVLSGTGANRTYKPNANYNGPDSFTFKINDGSADSNIATVTITVNSVNDGPTLDAIGTLMIKEDTSLPTINLAGISAGGGESQTLVITATSNNTTVVPHPTVNYTSPNATGTLTFMPVANANGFALITVTVNDGGGTANGGLETAVRTFTVTVNAVNDAPSFTKGPDHTVSVNAGAQTVNNWATNISAGPSDESGQALTFQIINNTNAALFSVAPAISSTGTLTYTPASNAAGAAQLTVVLKDNGDTANGGVDTSAPQTFNINLTAAALLSFSAANYNVNENGGSVSVIVNRTVDTSVAVTVDYATSDNSGPGSGSCGNGTPLLLPPSPGFASSRCDYNSVFGTLRFAIGETQKTIMVPITPDAFMEGPETFTITLSNPTGSGAMLVSPSTVTVTINDSASPTPNAIDDTDIFVRQQYHDFLNRDPDAPGLAFWKNNIDKCNDPTQRPPSQTLAQCIEVQRIVTSAAFFLSIEFQSSGGLVRDFYVAALDRPATGNMPSFVEFERDTQAVQAGVIVGQGTWQQTLNNNRDAFMKDFVMRPEFVGLYPTTDTPTQYVDKLYLHAGVMPGTPQERTDAIAEFGVATTASDPKARGRALWRITQNAAFDQREMNRCFVYMEYIGYLRRNPNDPPDSDFTGFDFWVNKLNLFNGDFFQAEMVKAFLSSAEYRRRFGP